MSEIFTKIESALRNKTRFTQAGFVLTLEDLYDIPLKGTRACLDSVAKDISRQLKQEEEESFVDEKSAASTVLNDKLDIVKHIIALKKEEDRKRKEVAEIKAHNEELDALIYEKRQEEKKGKSVEELEKLRR